jgi:putative ABC transport system permease protein
MFKSYLKLAWKVLWRRKFFTAISLFGISLTLVVLIVATALLDHTFAPMAPEVRQDRTLLVMNVAMTGPDSKWFDSAGYELLDKYARNLPNVERLALVTHPEAVYAYPGNQRVESSLRRSDAEFFRVLDYSFLEGGPFTDQEVGNAAPVAVINAATRDRFFGNDRAVGQWIDVDGQQFRVVGVVENVSDSRPVASGDIFVPLTTAKSDAYKTQLLGSFMGVLLARSREDFPGIKAELASRIRRVPLPDKDYTRLFAPALTSFETMAMDEFGGRDEGVPHAERFWAFIVGATFLFLLLPTVNLVNLNVSRIMERASEIGVRKAFGAPTGTLVLQFVVENVLLTCVGGFLGLVISAGALRAVTSAQIVKHAHLAINGRVFLYGLALSLIFGLLSGVYPAWRMARLNPVAALKGSTR